jgi:malonyl-CoA O-methyltransferase
MSYPPVLNPRSLDPYALDPKSLKRTFSRAARTFDAAAALQTEVRGRLLERLAPIRDNPSVVLDIGAGTGHGSRALKRRFPAAQVIALDFALPMLREARRQQSFFRKFGRICADTIKLPFRSHSVDWCVSNLALTWCEPLDPAFAEIRRVLKPKGLLTFTTLGPDTLRELRTAWDAIDRGPHVHRFVDMHDLGDALIRAGFAEPVLDVERIVLTYDEPAKLFRELKETGLTTATAGRVRHLGTRSLLRALAAAYEPLRIDGRIPATFEIVYGHAWRPLDADTRQTSDEVVIPLASIGRRRGS